MKMTEIQTNKYNDFSWDFIKENTKRDTHCFHNYPAMMIPQIADRLLEKYANNATLLFDPYCGTGTSLIEANIRNINAIGTDLNPLARLISKAKTTKINIELLTKSIMNFEKYIGDKHFENIEIPTFFNINFWFTEKVVKELSIIKEFINTLKDDKIQIFFKVAFSETIRESSLTRNSEFKLYRMNEKQMSKFKPNVMDLMKKKLMRNINGLEKYIINNANSVDSKIYDFNTVTEIPENLKDAVDIVLTSPPYGDSKTTVAYGQFSRLSNQWLDISNASKIDNMLMGGAKRKTIEKFNFEILDNVIKQIAIKNEKRALEVYSFYYDYLLSIMNISKAIKINGYACYVVGNRTVKEITLPTDEITKYFFEINGFKHIETIIRNIPNKRMPSKNSPTNIKGKKTSTMLKEYIVIMQKL